MSIFRQSVEAVDFQLSCVKQIFAWYFSSGTIWVQAGGAGSSVPDRNWHRGGILLLCDCFGCNYHDVVVRSLLVGTDDLLPAGSTVLAPFSVPVPSGGICIHKGANSEIRSGRELISCFLVRSTSVFMSFLSWLST